LNYRLVERLAKRSRLTEKDVDELAHKINREVFKELNKGFQDK